MMSKEKKPKRAVTYKGKEFKSRAELIRHLFNDEGMTRTEIAKELGVTYQVVWQATKVKKAKAVETETVEEAI